MADENELVENRKRIYNFLVQESRLMHWQPSIDSDKRLASFLDIDLRNLLALKNGEANPTQGLIKRVQDSFKSVIREGEIEAYFINPFK